MNELTYQNYASFKAELDKELMQEAAGFVRIGYLLRVAQDTNILSESEYDNVNDFAKAEYGLDKSQVSRFMAINERFSQGGYSDQLETQYQSFGVAKLSIMLQLPDVVNEQLTPDMTKSEINAIKEEVKEEEKISDIEVMLEEKSEDSLLKQVINNILEEHPDIFKKVWEENKKAQDFNILTESKDYAEDILAASGEALYTTRISGVGKVMLLIRNEMEKLTITNIRTGETEEPEWEELAECLRFKCAMSSAESAYEERFNKEFPEIEEEKPAKTPAKVVTTPKPEPKKEPKKEEHKTDLYKEAQTRISSEYGGDSDTKEAAGIKTAENEPTEMDESRISTECEADSDVSENVGKKADNIMAISDENEQKSSLNSQNSLSKQPKNVINPEYGGDSDTKEAAGIENAEVAPVQQSENVINTECEADIEDPELRALKNSLRQELELAMEFFEKGLWTSVNIKANKAAEIALKCRDREDELDDEEDEES